MESQRTCTFFPSRQLRARRFIQRQISGSEIRNKRRTHQIFIHTTPFVFFFLHQISKLRQISKLIILYNFTSILCSLDLKIVPIKAGFCLFRFTQGLRRTRVSPVSKGVVSDSYKPSVLGVHLHKPSA
jgi:hypothetical protein